MAGLYTRNLTPAAAITGESLLASSEETTDELFKTTINDVSTSLVDVEASTSLKAPHIQATTGVTDWPIKNQSGTDLAIISNDGVSFPQQPASAIYLSTAWTFPSSGWGVIPFDTIRFQRDNSQGWNIVTHKYYAPKAGLYYISMRFSVHSLLQVAPRQNSEYRVLRQGTETIASHRDYMWESVLAGTYWWGPSFSSVVELSLGDELTFEATSSTGSVIELVANPIYGTEAYLAKIG